MLGAGLVGFILLEQLWPMLGLWLFVAVSLTLGMGHGALDTVLLMGQFKPLPRTLLYALLYLGLTVLSGWLLSLSFSWALIALLLMSAWHFGEQYSERILLRLSVGGVSVMAPALTQNMALAQLLQGITIHDSTQLLGAWNVLAWAWVIGVGVIILGIIFRACQKTSSSINSAGPTETHGLLEIFLVLSLSFFLSPLLHFAIYFGLYHCTAHIARVRRAVVHHEGSSGALRFWAWCLVMLLTALLMAALWQWLSGSAQWTDQRDTQLVQWLVVALGAVTVPHLLLVSYSKRWLGR
jgi:Brp/Blh family beta-carotene 15,15'-monooxygenase